MVHAAEGIQGSAQVAAVVAAAVVVAAVLAAAPAGGQGQGLEEALGLDPGFLH